MKKLCAIISGGEPDDLTGIHEADFIIACDRGYAYAKEAGIRPDLLVGDFDSYRGALDKSVPVLDLPVEKDDTDTMARIVLRTSRLCTAYAGLRENHAAFTAIIV